MGKGEWGQERKERVGGKWWREGEGGGGQGDLWWGRKGESREGTYQVGNSGVG